MPTKAQLEEQLALQAAEKAELERQIDEAKRQSTHIPVTVADKIAKGSEQSEDEGSHALDHGTILDNHMEPDTNLEAVEDIDARNANDLSFWNGSWTWAKAAKSYGNKPQDSWFINPTPKLIGEVMANAPTIFGACEVALISKQAEQMTRERNRHLEFLRDAEEGDLVSEALDLLTAYQSRYLESVQRYIGLAASYENQQNNKNITSEQIESAQLRKEDAGKQCRAWAAKLIALVESYHSVVSDERAYNLTYDFAPLPPQDGQPASKAYGLFKWSVTNTLNKTGRRLARSIKEGKMDAEKYRIPRPWLTETQKTHQLDANTMISDFG